MNKLNITRTTGAITRPQRNEDHVSGLIICINSEIYAANFKSIFEEYFEGAAPPHIARISTEDTLKKFTGLESWQNDKVDTPRFWWRFVHYYISEFLRTSQGGTLYVTLTDGSDTSAITKMQRYAGGAIRQLAYVDWSVYHFLEDGPADMLNALQAEATQCDAEGAPLSIIYEPFIAREPEEYDAFDMTQCPNVSVSLGCDCSEQATNLRSEMAMLNAGAAGTVLGLLSRAKVNESIAWVKQFPLGFSNPGILNGDDGVPLTRLAAEVLESLDEQRYIFPVTYPGISGSYLNASHCMTPATDEYAYIENQRTMDKAVRGIRTALIPELGGNVYVDAATGHLAAHSVAHLETIASHPLEEMEKAGEISGYSVEIDPEQNVISSGTLDIVIKKVDVGVMRTINVALGNVTSL